VLAGIKGSGNIQKPRDDVTGPRVGLPNTPERRDSDTIESWDKAGRAVKTEMMKTRQRERKSLLNVELSKDNRPRANEPRSHLPGVQT